MYTRVVEELGMRKGRPINMLTGRMMPIDVGTVDDEDPYPVWDANPFVDIIVDAEAIAPELLQKINAVHESHCQFGHMISNICAEYGLSSNCSKTNCWYSVPPSVETSRRPHLTSSRSLLIIPSYRKGMHQILDFHFSVKGCI